MSSLNAKLTYLEIQMMNAIEYYTPHVCIGIKHNGLEFI